MGSDVNPLISQANENLSNVTCCTTELCLDIARNEMGLATEVGVDNISIAKLEPMTLTLALRSLMLPSNHKHKLGDGV